MSDPRDRVAMFRQWVKSKVMPAVGARRASGSDCQIYARARPELVRLTEHYFVSQEISGNPQKSVSARPTGTIEMSVPYDGFEYFTRQACADVKWNAARHRPADTASALIGHLLLTNYNRTDLSDVLALRQRYGSVPIHVPINGLGTEDDLEELQADQQRCVISYDYAADTEQLRVIPIDLKVDLLDPDSIDSHRTDAVTNIDIRNPPPGMTQQVSFRPYLILSVVVRAIVPKVEGWESLRPEVANVSLRWPTITSLRAVNLEVNDHPAPIRYNPLTRSIEWAGVSMSVGDTSDDNDTLIYQSEPMLVLIEQPGELYQQDSIEGSVEVRIDDYLLSGVEAKLANGIGRLDDDDQPERVTYLKADVKLILDDAFAKRMVSPYQHLYFDEIIPDSMRIDDIEAALKDRGFNVKVGDTSNLNPIHLLAERSEGPKKMVLWLQVQGQKFQTERENKRPGGHTYKSIFESGELKVFIRGSFRRDSLEVTREMNALQQALRERFDRLRSNR